KQGFNGLITTNASNQSRYNSTLVMNYKPGKLNLYSTYGFRQDNRPRKMTDLRTIYDSVPTTYGQYRKSDARPISHNVTAGADYSINDKNVIGVSGTYFYMNFLRQENTSIILHDQENKVTSDYSRDRLDKEYEYEKEISASYEHQFEKEDHAIQFEFNFADHFEQEDNHYTQTYRTPYKPKTYDNTLIKQFEKQTECIVEYVYPINEDSELEAGYEWVTLKQNFDFHGEYLDTIQNVFIKDVEKSNRFNFTQNVHAIYATYSQSIEDFNFLLGLRAEQAYITSNLVTMDSIIQNNYFKVYPTIHLSYELDDNKELQLSYSKRVNRPEGDELNPFPEYRDPRNIGAGNPNLKPEQIHSIEFGYQYKGKKISVFPTIFYRYMYDGFAEISKYINDSTLLTTSENLSTDQSAGLELVLTMQVKKILSLNLSGDAFYNQIDASNLGYSEKKSAFSYTAKLGANINLTTSTVMQINTNYRSTQLTPQGRYLPTFTLNAGMRQDIFKKKVSILLTVSDVFNTLRWTSEINTPVLSQKITSKRTSQIFYLGFTYRFGKATKAPAEELKFDDKM
ncbi:MAG: TonB-dependent receptor, partial [Bacteroidetes bacterium]|nr:TonB-dependent receptor [Bacteroidota bacterium]